MKNALDEFLIKPSRQKNKKTKEKKKRSEDTDAKVDRKKAVQRIREQEALLDLDD